jgi:hypothetical protein
MVALLLAPYGIPLLLHCKCQTVLHREAKRRASPARQGIRTGTTRQQKPRRCSYVRSGS